MASDISSIIQSELVNTFDSLLSLQSSIEAVNKQSSEEIQDNEYIKIEINLEMSAENSILYVYLSKEIATKFEYFMLGGIGDIKLDIDDETIDACKEIMATVGGGLSTTIKAQNFEDINNFSFSLKDTTLIKSEQIINTSNLYKFEVKLADEIFYLLIDFDNVILPFIDTFTSENKVEVESQSDNSSNTNVSNLDSVLSILGENSSDNLKLLFDVQLKFSVRLGKKTFLLKDIVNWDVGQIIELEQMVNEPLDLLINNVKVGVGEAVIVEGKFGIKVKYIGEEN